MKINQLKISGIGGIKELELKFCPGFNVLCGPNGIGKSTILKIIANSFASYSTILKRNANYEIGTYSLEYVDVNNKTINRSFTVMEFEPQKQDLNSHVTDETSFVMYFREDRSMEYQSIQAIPRDVSNNKYQVGNDLGFGIKGDIKGWFDNRYLFAATDEGLSKEKKSNFELAKRCFSILDPNVCFKTVDPTSLDIKVTTLNGEVYLEYLSAGYKSCLYLLLGLIREIEFRFIGTEYKVTDFDGVILIDELDLHLHPIWQAKMVSALKVLFPKAQFITTTHSPSVLQSLRKEEIIPLAQDGEGNIFVKELVLSEYGLQGWSIEEILRDVMEMPETTSELFEETKKSFDKAMNNDDNITALKEYELLKKMLHPDSILRRLLEIQIAGIGD